MRKRNISHMAFQTRKLIDRDTSLLNREEEEKIKKTK